MRPRREPQTSNTSAHSSTTKFVISTKQLQKMEPDPLNDEFTLLSIGNGHKTIGESEGRVSSQRRKKRYEPPLLLGEDCRSLLVNSLSPPLTSEGRRPPLVDGLSPPHLSEHIGPPLLSDRSYREAAEVGDTEALWASHREYIDPSTCASQYRLPSEIEYPEDGWWAELSHAENEGTECLTSGNYSDEIDTSLYQGPVYGIDPSQYPGPVYGIDPSQYSGPVYGIGPSQYPRLVYGIDPSQYPGPVYEIDLNLYQGPVYGIDPSIHQPVNGAPTGPRYSGDQYRQTFNGSGRYSYRRDRGGRGRYQGSRRPYAVHGTQPVSFPDPQGQSETRLARNNGGR